MPIFSELLVLFCRAIVFALCTMAASVPASAAVNCTSDIDLSKDITWRPVKQGIKKLHFLAPTSEDRPNCPGGDGCQLPAFLASGDQVIVTTTAYEPKHKKSLICGVYISTQGKMTFGWLDASGFFGGGNILSEIDDPKVFGDWIDLGGDKIAIRPAAKGSYLDIEGSVAEGSGDFYREGYIAGPAFIGNGTGGHVAGYSDSHYDGSSSAITQSVADEDTCRVRFRFTGYYLLVDDNYKCGNHESVSFSGVYIRQHAKKQ